MTSCTLSLAPLGERVARARVFISGRGSDEGVSSRSFAPEKRGLDASGVAACSGEMTLPCHSRERGNPLILHASRKDTRTALRGFGLSRPAHCKTRQCS